jgi:plasmid stabilization system protein ParE
LHDRNPDGARNVALAICAGIQLIAENPLSTQQTDIAGVRVKIVRRYRYKIFFRVHDEWIEIIHVRHTSRQPWSG